ncbi:guanitoxin biosynthesis heme-dependent pre-guanitoxin N-hydroxylase GntA [uncultured Methylobacterium sp.]|uniref:guanitoxin biosynthesis heme-dependent pre-guanitoxin N-hydroxylase GntA n=1 Tax=uncultured Methylobacterium sp. TaxID=157278 RepID=UPI0026281780|nr:guanitoxin biosynthesis heme-dependent pre-guanitoxin N-hydroxylase GntA [uncultured Methylobacterium sp.]
MPLPRDDRGHPRAEAFRAFIGEAGFPCVGAKAALSRGGMRVLVARSVTSAWDDMRIYPALLAFAARYRARPDLFQSFAVVFEDRDTLSEEAFERHLWARLQSLADKDAGLGHRWDERVAADPGSPHFSLSFAGEAFFVVGLHPGASRPARRFASPALVFNPHRQFEQLREAGRYERLRAAILQRDVALAGSVNPMLARHGETSEARQYSGRAVDESWRCPFRPRAQAGGHDVR